jgi:hypothetical protein
MEKVGVNPLNMTDWEQEDYENYCRELKGKLDQSIQYLMHFIFEGRCKHKAQWESLFMSLCKAVFLKEYLQIYTTNLGFIAQDFLDQFDEWYQDVLNSLS